MSKQALVQFQEFPISVENLRSLPGEHVAAMAALEYAVSEVNALRRVFLSQSHVYTGDRVIDEAMSIQRLVILRTWSSKLFEAKEFLGSLCGKKPVSIDQRLNDLASEALLSLAASESSEGYEVARDVRHEASNHYPFEVARKNIEYIHKDALLSMFVHEHVGNDFFPMGEAVMFHGRLHRRWKNVPSLEERRRKFKLWIDWCIELTDKLIASHAKFASVLIFGALGRNTLYQRNFWVPEETVGHPLNSLTPVFFREDPIS